MTVRIKAEKLTAAAFAPYGDVLDASGEPDKLINQGQMRAVPRPGHIGFCRWSCRRQHLQGRDGNAATVAGDG